LSTEKEECPLFFPLQKLSYTLATGMSRDAVRRVMPCPDNGDCQYVWAYSADGRGVVSWREIGGEMCFLVFNSEQKLITPRLLKAGESTPLEVMDWETSLREERGHN
jgi:hypothetical protein